MTFIAVDVLHLLSRSVCHVSDNGVLRGAGQNMTQSTASYWEIVSAQLEYIYILEYHDI